MRKISIVGTGPEAWKIRVTDETGAIIPVAWNSDDAIRVYEKDGLLAADVTLYVDEIDLTVKPSVVSFTKVHLPDDRGRSLMMEKETLAVDETCLKSYGFHDHGNGPIADGEHDHCTLRKGHDGDCGRPMSSTIWQG